jgi:hypothetical protein
VFRLGEDDLLALIVSFADGPDLETMARDAAALEPEAIMLVEVTSGERALLRSAVPWPQTTVVAEAAGSSIPRDRETADTGALVVRQTPGIHAVGEIRVDCDRYGLDAWRIRRA